MKTDVPFLITSRSFLLRMKNISHISLQWLPPLPMPATDSWLKFDVYFSKRYGAARGFCSAIPA